MKRHCFLHDFGQKHLDRAVQKLPHSASMRRESGPSSGKRREKFDTP
jgi:hypothetical protein